MYKLIEKPDPYRKYVEFSIIEDGKEIPIYGRYYLSDGPEKKLKRKLEIIKTYLYQKELEKSTLKATD